MTTIFDQIVQAFNGPVPDKCPISHKPKEERQLLDLPEKARKLLPLWHKLQEQAGKLARCNGKDEGVWFRHHNETEAIEQIIHNIIRIEDKVSYRASIELFADWKYATSGA